MQIIHLQPSIEVRSFPFRFGAIPLVGMTLLALNMPRTVHAAVASLVPGITTVADGGIAPGGETDYAFFGDGNPIVLPDFTLSNVTAQYHGVSSNSPQYSTLQTPSGGAAFTTGIAYNNTAGQVNLANFTLNAGSNQNYTVSVLFGNSDGNAVFDQSISLSVDGGTAVTAAVSDTQSSNEFLTFNITGLNAGDTLMFSAMPAVQDAFGHTNPAPYIGAVSFAAVPEPSTWTVLLGGVVYALGVMLRRYNRQA